MKIVIIGNSGSGKTFLATKLSTSKQIPIVHLDDLFWTPGGFDQKREPHEVKKLISESKKGDSWVAEGVFGELAGEYLSDAGLLIWLDIEWVLCCSRLKQRGSESKKHLGRTQSQEGLKKLIVWASNYYKRENLKSYIGHMNLYDSFKGKKVCLKNESETNLFAETFY